jgi:hypothetical protein
MMKTSINVNISGGGANVTDSVSECVLLDIPAIRHLYSLWQTVQKVWSESNSDLNALQVFFYTAESQSNLCASLKAVWQGVHLLSSKGTVSQNQGLISEYFFHMNGYIHSVKKITISFCLWRMPSSGMWRRVDLATQKIYTAAHLRRRHSS